MLDRAEFGSRDNVTFWDGKRFFNAHVSKVRMNHITESVEYSIYYRINASESGFMRHTVSPHQIKESKHFVEGDNGRKRPDR